jgi:twinkle protein
MKDIIEFVKTKNWKYKHRGDELDIEVCPICNAGAKKGEKPKTENLWSFGINLKKGYYKCLRGTCDSRGHINTLAKRKVYQGNYKPIESDFNDTVFNKELLNQFIGKPVLAASVESTKLEFIEKRKISSKTLKKLNCYADSKTGDLIIPAYEEGIPVNFKRRFVKPIEIKGRLLKTKNSSSGKSVLYGMQNCIEFNKPLVIVEGDFEYLTLVECGYNNVVSIPNGATSIKFLEYCYEFLDNFKSIILWYDNDKAGETGKKKLAEKLLKFRLSHIVSAEKDANEVLKINGKEKVIEYIKKAKEYEVDGIKDLSKVERVKARELNRVSCGIFAIDYYMKGLREAELTIWSGKNNHGKSTMIGQFILNLAENKQHVFLYSGELTKSQIKEWIFSQACTVDDLVSYTDEITKSTEYEVKDDVFEMINIWVEGRIFIYNKDDIAKEDELLALMERAYYQKGCTHFYLDNLMMMQMQNEGSDIYKRQSIFMNKIKSFTKRGVHCNVVVHPYKTKDEIITKDDVGGTGDITNIADNVLIVHKMEVDENNNYPAMVNVDKGRIGRTGKVYLEFNQRTKRYYSPRSTTEENFSYGWNNIKVNNKDKNPIKNEIPELFKGMI